MANLLTSDSISSFQVSAQDSRKRKKEYVDAMEDRVRRCSVENDELHKKIELLETQNKTLAGQLRRLHQIIVNGGLRQTQTSTAMMVLLLSTALFLIPGFKESQGAENDSRDITYHQCMGMTVRADCEKKKL